MAKTLPPDLPGTSIAEWILAAVSALMLAGFFALTLAWSLRTPPGPPDLAARVLSVTPGAGGFHVRLRVENGSAAAAAAVAIVGDLVIGTDPPIERQATLDYVPGHSTRDGGLLFPVDPARGRLTVSVAGYADP